MDNDLNNKIQQGIKDYMNSAQYSVTKIQSHLHNGMDTGRIKQVDIIPSIGYSAYFTFNTTETFILQNVPNVRRLTFSGFAANNNAAPATQRAIINGEVLFGKFYTYTGSGTIISVNSNDAQVYQFIQSGNSMFVDSTDLTKNKVTASNGLFDNTAHTGGFVTVVDGTGAEVANVGVLSYENNRITFGVYVAADWKIQGLLTLT